jgi:hypothetical protein
MRSHTAGTFIKFLTDVAGMAVQAEFRVPGTDEFAQAQREAHEFASDVTVFDAWVPGVDLFFCTMGGVPIEFMGGYAVDAMTDGEAGDA